MQTLEGRRFEHVSRKPTFAPTTRSLEELAEDGGDFADDDAERQAAGAKLAIEFIVGIGWTDEKFFHFGPPFFETFSMRVTGISPVAEKALAHLGPFPEQVCRVRSCR